MATRAIIGKVDRRGDGQAIYLGHDGDPDQAGATLLEHYSEEGRVDRLIRLGSVTWLEARPEDSITYFRDHAQPWENCRPHEFGGGTERFFARYWGVGPEWLYICTPDGWLAGKLPRRLEGAARRRSPMAGVAAAHAGASAAAIAPLPD
ncbi:MAG: hypothetical protein OXM01_08840 [Gemmatimonadota bacterium]|nr:hypothetical protein [Gemmatimonadota bacterium]